MKVVLFEKVDLVSFDKIISTVSETVKVFSSLEKMHKHCAKVAFDLEEKGLAFNGKNANRHFVYLTKHKIIN